MELFLVVFFVMLILIAIMSIGVIMGRKPIAGSCGGMSALGMDVACDICKGDKSICDTEIDKANKDVANRANAERLSYNAMDRSESH